MTKAMAAYKKACDLGHQPSCYKYGHHQRMGQFLPKDVAQGLQRMQTACDASVGDACFEIGVMYDNAEGVARDRQRALAYYKQGCTGGSEQACAKARYR
jgi:TPR repeat protein